MMPFDVNKPVQTSKGEEAFATQGPDNLLYGWYRDGTRICPGRWDVGGNYYGGFDRSTGVRLVNVPQRRFVRVWINAYETNGWGVSLSREDADDTATHFRIACIEREIAFEIGEGLRKP